MLPGIEKMCQLLTLAKYQDISEFSIASIAEFGSVENTDGVQFD